MEGIGGMRDNLLFYIATSTLAIMIMAILGIVIWAILTVDMSWAEQMELLWVQ